MVGVLDEDDFVFSGTYYILAEDAEVAVVDFRFHGMAGGLDDEHARVEAAEVFNLDPSDFGHGFVVGEFAAGCPDGIEGEEVFVFGGFCYVGFYLDCFCFCYCFCCFVFFQQAFQVFA